MLEKYNEFTHRKKAIDKQKIEYKKKINNLNKEKLKIKINQFSKQKQEIQKRMNKYVAGNSNYN